MQWAFVFIQLLKNSCFNGIKKNQNTKTNKKLKLSWAPTHFVCWNNQLIIKWLILEPSGLAGSLSPVVMRADSDWLPCRCREAQPCWGQMLAGSGLFTGIFGRWMQLRGSALQIDLSALLWLSPLCIAPAAHMQTSAGSPFPASFWRIKSGAQKGALMMGQRWNCMQK